eukprot:755367-Hanusia_phi.AAC.1
MSLRERMIARGITDEEEIEDRLSQAENDMKAVEDDQGTMKTMTMMMMIMIMMMMMQTCLLRCDAFSTNIRDSKIQISSIITSPTTICKKRTSSSRL